MTDDGSAWPEQDIISAWLAKRDWIKIEFEDRLALQKELTKLRQSLSQEAVRDEALEGVLATAEGTFVPAVILDGKRLPDEYGDWRALPRHPTWQMKEAGGEAYLQSKELEGQNTGLTAMHMAEGIYHAMWKTPEVGLSSALKREPNAEAQASGSSEHTVASANPAPAAPDVAEMVKRLRNYANESGGAQVEQDLLEAAALLELLGQRARSPALLLRLGQGGFTPDPTTELLVSKLCNPDTSETKY